MKRIFCLILALLLLLSGCLNRKERENTVRFCYPRSTVQYGEEDGVIAWEEREASGNLEYLLALYFAGPEDITLSAPLPAGTQLLNIARNDEILALTFSGELDALQGMDLTVTGACIASTCFALTDAGQVVLRTKENLSVFSALREDSFLLYDDTAAETDPSQ